MSAYRAGEIDAITNAPFEPLALKTAMAYGILVASFNVEGFGLERMYEISRDDIEERMAAYKKMLSF